MNSNKLQNFQPSKYTKYFLMLSATIFLIGLIMFCVLGFNLGMDFTGGSVLEVKVGEEISQDGKFNELSDDIENILADNGVHASSIQMKGTGEEASIEVQYQTPAGVENMEDVNTTICDTISSELGYSASANFKSATSTSETLTYALMAVFLALIAMLIYIAIRFKLLSGIATIVILLHDVLLMCALVAIFRIEVNASFIAAIITILGYSINNTIIIFDRLRENTSKASLTHLSPMQIADLSVKQTLNRTINTSITTIMAVFLLAVVGVPSMTEFVLPILFGLLVGTYASIFISAPIWAYLMKKNPNLGMKEVKREKNKDGDDVVETTAIPV
ncbi:MAG: protein translocase subunit SecF [Clostridia bacterium]|nr:protein translocase subunit SecF [Clostridia bacterium]